ncbi:hypothetical protein ADL27_53305 [Streptomyces sp. NRRL F-6602]|nr:hypothetical protein ADL27_53305 [Streptomyces sp. NRRL F-6602]
MTEWNLSVRLTGQGTDLARTLRGLSRDADRASANVRALRRDITQLRQQARRPIKLRFDVDSRSIQREIQRAVGGSLSVDMHLGNRAQLRQEVKDAVRWAAWGHRIEIPIGLRDPNRLRRDVSDAVRGAQRNQRIRLRVDVDSSALRSLTAGAASGAAASAGKGIGSLIPLATAAVPLIAGLAANLAPLGGMLNAAAVGAGAFGAAIAGQAEELGELADAEKAYQEAVRDNGRGSLEAAEAQLAYQRQLAALPPETQRAAVAISGLKSSFQGWSDDMARFTMEPVTKGVTVLEQLLPRLTPEVQSFSEQMNRLMDVAGGAITTPGFDAIADRVAAFTDSRLDSFTDQVIHLLRVASEGGDPSGGVLGQILEYARQNGPAAREALDAVGDTVGMLAEAAAEAGPTMLTLVTAVANLVGALPPEAVALVLQLAAALKLVQLAGLGAAAVSAGVTRLSTAVAALGATSAAAGGGIAGLRAAVASLSTGARFGAAAAGVAALVFALHELSDNKPAVQVDELSTSLNTLLSTGKVTGTLSSNLTEMSESIAMVSKSASDNKLAQWTSDFGTWVGIAEGPGISTARENVDAWDKSMAQLVRSGNPKQAAAQYELLKKAWVAGGGDLERLKDFTTDYDNALADLAFEQEMTAASMGVFGKAAMDVQAKLDAQKSAADGLRASILALNETNRAAHDAQTDFEEAVDNLTASFKEHGNTLNADTEAGRANRDAMSEAAAAQDALLVSGMAAGESFESLVGKTDKLRDSMLTLATKAFDGNRQKAVAYVNTLLGTPAEVKTTITLERQAAIQGLQDVQDAITATPDSHRIVVDTLNATAIAALEAVGLKTEQLPDGRTAVYTANGQALGSIAAVDNALTKLDGKTARTYTTHTTDYYENYFVNRSTGEARSRNKLRPGHMADGSILDFYADGGLRDGLRPFPRGESHVAQIAPAGSWRVWAEPETGGEAYIPLTPSKRARSRAILEETTRRLGGDPSGIQWNADGSLTGWSYDPVSGSLYSPSDAASIGHKTRKVKTKGGKVKEVKYYDIAAVEKKLWDLGAATVAWNRNLEKVADRAGGDVAKALASMGNEGVALAAKMAKGTDKYVASMSIALRRMMQEARASLTDFTVQLNHATGNNQIFQANLVKLAAMGYGDLASHLAAKGDQASMELAADAATSRSKAAKANAAVKKAKAQLSTEEMGTLVDIIAAITSKTVGIHQVADKTGIGEDVIIEVANKAKSQISKSLGTKATKFLADLGKANRQQAYADGGIRAGLYATQGGIIRFAEPSTRGEAYIPLGLNKRRTALPVLADVAHRFGVGLTDANGGKVIVVRENGPLIGQQVNNVHTNGNARDVSRQIEQRFAYQLRRARRGGVAARG